MLRNGLVSTQLFFAENKLFSILFFFLVNMRFRQCRSVLLYLCSIREGFLYGIGSSSLYDTFRSILVLRYSRVAIIEVF